MIQGWRATERFGDGAETAGELNESILDAMNNGTSGLWLSVGASLAPGDLATALAGVYLDLVPVTLPGGWGAHKWVDRRGLESPRWDAVTDALLVDEDGSVLETGRGNVQKRLDGNGALQPFSAFGEERRKGRTTYASETISSSLKRRQRDSYVER